MTKTDILNDIATIAASTLPPSGIVGIDERAAFANAMQPYIQATVIPEKDAKPAIRF